jgi:SAM-dependent methyltransferase
MSTGTNPSPWSNDFTRLRTPREEIFHKIYAANLWGDSESVSGPGSNRERTAAFREELPPLLEEFNIKSVLDAPCGDFNWMSQLNWRLEQYIGVDIVAEIVAANERAHGNATRAFLHLDLISDPLPYADVIVCRDCLVHFSIAEIRDALMNFKRSGAAYLLATTFPRVRENSETQTGGWRPINLQQPPFDFPPPLRLVDERRRYPDGQDAAKYLGLWMMDAV